MQILRIYFFCFLCIFQTFVSGETINKTPIAIVYHIATLNNWQEIVKEQIQDIATSGLGDACDEFFVTVAGPHIHAVYPLFEGYSFSHKTNILHAGNDLQLFEFPGIETVQAIAKNNPLSKILYLHTKGVSYQGQPCEKNVGQWRRFMQYFAVNKWKDCIKALEEVDACGVDWGFTYFGVPCFAGNFWWANGDYINKCILHHNSRYDCEMFIGTANPVVKNFLSSGRNPRLLQFFTPAQIDSFQMFPPNVFWHQGVFHWINFYYDDAYYRD